MSLTPEDLREVLLRLQEVAGEMVLVGGQAVNLWATYYATASPEWEALRPYASRDLDFYGGRVEVVMCADVLGGRARVNRDFDASPNAGIVTVVFQGKALQIDILATVFGVSDAEIVSTALPFQGSGLLAGVCLNVLNPMLCLEGKLKSWSNLPQSGRQDAKHSLLSLLIVREYLKDQCLDLEPRVGLRLIERLFRTGLSESGLKAWNKLDLQVETAIPIEQLQGFENQAWQRFIETRWPQFLDQLQQKRQRYRQISQMLEQKQSAADDKTSENEDRF
jgi:hypothetical protein